VVPSGLGVGAAGALGPQETTALLQNVLETQAAPSKIALNQAQTEHLKNLGTFEQQAGLQLLDRLLWLEGQGSSSAYPRVALNVGPDGKQTDARDRHYWVVHPQTGERLSYIGPVTSPEPEGGAGGKTTGADLDAFFRYSAPQFWQEATSPRTTNENSAKILAELTDPVTGTVRPERFLARLSPKSRVQMIDQMLETFPNSPIVQNLAKTYKTQATVPQGGDVPNSNGRVVDNKYIDPLTGLKYNIESQGSTVYIVNPADGKRYPWTP